MKRIIIALLSISFVTGCANFNKKAPISDVKSNSQLARLASCEKFYQSLDDIVQLEKITDVQSTPIDGTLFLSINRFLLSFKHELSTDKKIDFWFEESTRLNLKKRQVEWNNLSQFARASIKSQHLHASTFSKRIASCSSEFLHRLTKSSKQQFITAAAVNDDYSTAMRALGIYPITSLILKNKIDKHHKETRETFNKALGQLKVDHDLQRYTVDPGASKLTFFSNIKKENALHIPFISSQLINELFIQYAPTIEVDDGGKYDQIGTVKLNKDKTPYIDVSEPLVYTLPSYTRFEGKILLQLNYFFWFSERPSEGSFDLYSGKFDGLIWRVTLDQDLSPIMFDSAHSCGCYHKFYSTKKVKFKLQEALLEKEPVFLAQKNIDLVLGKQLIIRINSGKHFIERVYQDTRFDKNAKPYAMTSYHKLRNLAGNNVSKSFFNDTGLVETSERSERFLLWPMGVPSAGAMRQWGHHTIAFIGKRYFDDPNLLNVYFESVK